MHARRSPRLSDRRARLPVLSDRALCCGAALGLLLGLGPEVRAGTIFVDQANTSGVEDGTPAHPYDTIQEGVDNAVAGDRVSVAPGIYNERVLMKGGVDVQGDGAATTTIDGSGLQASVVVFNETNPGPTLSGFTITGGRGDLNGDIGGTPVKIGGGVLIINSSPRIVDNRIHANVVDDGYCFGGGVYVDATLHTPKLVGNIIEDNVALSATVTDQGRGGGIYVAAKDGGIVLERNILRGNGAFEGGGLYFEGSAAASATVRRNEFRANDARSGGGALGRSLDSTLGTIVNNLFRDNGSADAGARGGGMLAEAAGAGEWSIVNNTLYGNAMPAGDGGGLWLDDSASSAAGLVANNVLAANSANRGGGIDHALFDGTIRNNTFHANAGGDLHDGGTSGALLLDNRFEDPRLVGPAAGNLRLREDSGSIDRADDPSAPLDDSDGFVRPYDGDGDAVAAADIGAHEFPSGEVFGLVFLDERTIDWNPLALTGDYNLYRGALARLRSTGEYTQDPSGVPGAARFCHIADSALPFDEPFLPGPGETVFYLVSFASGGWEGILGTDDSGRLRSNPNPCPP